MQATIEDIIPGRVLYYVDFVIGDSSTTHEPKLTNKVIVLTHPNTHNNIGHLCFSCIDDYRPYGFEWMREDAHHYLGDVGIGTIHNMHRLFTNEESALAYVEECRVGKFSCKENQEGYDRFMQQRSEGLYDDPYDYGDFY